MGHASAEPLHLASLGLFEGCDPADLGRLEDELIPSEAADGDILLRQGEPATWFGVILDGEVVVERTDDSGPRRLAVAGPGSIVGELALLRDAPRSATVTARGRIGWLKGDRGALGRMFDLPGVHERMAKLAAQKLAAQAVPVVLPVKRGARFLVRPLLPGDRDELVAGIDHLSEESRRRRFFTGGSLPSRLVDYLVDLDYANHFAWVAFPDDADRRGGAVARYIRLRDDPRTAELAVAVADEHQGLGLGSGLVGALAAAAEAGGVQRFSATALSDNAPVKALLGRAGAVWQPSEPGVLATSVDVSRVVRTLPPDLAESFRNVAASTMSASHVPLA